jgi:hypothetical protein
MPFRWRTFVLIAMLGGCETHQQDAIVGASIAAPPPPTFATAQPVADSADTLPSGALPRWRRPELSPTSPPSPPRQSPLANINPPPQLQQQLTNGFEIDLVIQAPVTKPRHTVVTVGQCHVCYDTWQNLYHVKRPESRALPALSFQSALRSCVNLDDLAVAEGASVAPMQLAVVLQSSSLPVSNPALPSMSSWEWCHR